ncbi:MAG: alpha/beta fold hydrolase [Oligoflexus sp.]
MSLKRYAASALLVWFMTPYASAKENAVRTLNDGNLVLDGIPEIPDDIASELDRYQNSRTARFMGWLPDGSGMLMSTRFGDTSQVHVVRQPLGSRTQLTFFSEQVMFASPRPNASKNPSFLFLKDEGGDEYMQIFNFDINTGKHELLSDGKSRYGSLVWAKSGKFYLFNTNSRNGTDTDVYWANPDSKEVRRLTEAPGYWGAVAVDPKEEHVLIRRYISINAAELHLLNLKTKKMSRLFPKEKAEQIAYGNAVFSHDGAKLFYVSDENREFMTLRSYELKSGRETLISEDIPWNVEWLALEKNGRQLAFSTNEGGWGQLYLYDTKSNKKQQLQKLPKGLIYGFDFSPDGKSLAIVLETSKNPGDIFVYDLKKKNLVQWTESETGGLSSDAFVEPELIQYPTFDQVDNKPRQIPAFYYRPAKKQSKPLPVLISIHGGPEAQYRPSFSPLFQYIVNEFGAAVIAPNVRGSAGYGKSYLKLDNGKLREDSVKDIGALLDWIASRPELDEKRVIVYGGSYGGYMVLASMAHYNDRLAGGIDVVGISNFVTFLKNTKGYRRDLRRVEYGDEQDPDMRAFLQTISPTENVQKITKPLFVAQGLNDPRVPASEAEQIVTKVRENGGKVWYFLAKDEGHGFRKKANRDVFQQTMLMFIQEQLVTEGKKTAGS